MMMILLLRLLLLLDEAKWQTHTFFVVLCCTYSEWHNEQNTESHAESINLVALVLMFNIMECSH